MVDCVARCGKLFATSVVFMRNSERLPVSLSLVMLTLRRSEW